MGSPAHRVRLRALVREEVRALPRSTFALLALAVVLALVAVPVAGLMVGEAGLDETLVFTWLLLPLVVAIVVAARVAGARRTRFVDSLYTTPLAQRTWFGAQASVGCVLGLLALAVQLPFLVVSIVWLGIPDVVPQAVLAALGITAFAVALGLFCGVVLGDASPLAAAGLAGGLGFVAFILFMVHSLLVQEPATVARDVMLRATALSPLTLASDASGIGLAGRLPASVWRPAVGLALLSGALAAASWAAYTKGQTPLGWEPRGGRALVVGLVAVALVAPVATAEVSFEPGPPGAGYEPGEHTWVTIVPRGAPATDASFTYLERAEAPDMPPHTDVAYDVLVLAVAPEGAAVRDVDIKVEGSAAVRVVSGGALRVASGATGEQVRAPSGAFEKGVAGPPRPLYRVPVTLRAVSFSELDTSPAPVRVHTEFRADGKRLSSDAQFILHGAVPWAFAQLLGAGLVLPALAGAGFARRKWSTR